MTGTPSSAFRPQNEILVRPLREEDLPDLEWDGEYVHFRDLYRRAYEDMLLGSRLMMVAEVPVTGEIIGQVFLQYSSGDPRFADGRTRGYIYALRVKRPYQNQGIGRRLIGAAEENLREKGLRVATIGVAKTNTGAQRLYQRLGYRIREEDAGRWTYQDEKGHLREVNEPSWLMEHSLDSQASQARGEG